MKKTHRRLISFILGLMLALSAFPAATARAHAATSCSISVDTANWYGIKNVATGKYLNVYGNRSANNTNITVWDWDGTSGVYYQFAKSGSGYVITPKCAAGRAVNVYGSSASAGSNVCTWTKSGHSTQAWVIEYVPAQNGFIFRSANNKSVALAASGKSNGSNVCLKQYNANDTYQIWQCSGISIKGAAAAGAASPLSAENIKTQITNTYAAAKKASGYSSFNGWCGAFVRYQLNALGIIRVSGDTDCRGNGNQWYANVKEGQTSTGYTKTKLPGGANCLSNIVRTYGGNLSNIVISYPRQYGYSNSRPGAGHVVLIHAVINGVVYYSESYRSNGVPEGSVLTKTVEAFDAAYTASYGNALGAIYFHK